jgi:glycerophosphoryl diester phosphodiesterase
MNAMQDRPHPLIIGHRGASGHRPEHTLASYALAIELGADFIEPDLVLTRDGVLVARHENEISGTTDVAAHPEFAARRTTRTVDGPSVSGWFTEDFTLAELKTLRARERIPAIRPANTLYDGQFEIPTLAEIIDLAQRESTARGRGIGIYPETKHPSYFASIGLPFDHVLVDQLHAAGYRGPNAPVYLQSFEVGNLRRLAKLTDLPLIQLLTERGQPFDFVMGGDARTYADLASPAGLAEIAGYARGVGAVKGLILPRGEADTELPPSTLIVDAHAAGLVVHAWTFRDEDRFLPPEDHGNPDAEYMRYFRLGVDGVFTDFPGTAFRARASFWGER